MINILAAPRGREYHQIPLSLPVSRKPTKAAVASGASYIGCGPAFATPLKPQKEVIGPDGVVAVTKAARVPVFAIGGIDESNIGQLTSHAIRRVCVIRAIGGAANPEAVTRRLRAMLDA